MPVRSESRKRWTLAELRQVRERNADGTRYELVRGQLLVTPAPSGAHQNAVLLLGAALYGYVRSEGVGHAAVAPRDIDFPSEQASIQPDVFVVPLADIPRFLGNQPVERLLLAVEVLSPSSARVDRVVKRLLLQRHGVSEYWIVDLEARVVECWRPSDERPRVITDRLDWRPAGAVRPFVLDLAPFFAEALGVDTTPLGP